MKRKKKEKGNDDLGIGTTDKKFKTSDYVKFQKYCLAYQKLFHRDDWFLSFRFRKICNDANAQFILVPDARLVEITLQKGEVTGPPDLLRLVAKHEIIEALIIGKLRDWGYRWAGADRFKRDQVEEEGHAITQLLMKLLPDPEEKKKKKNAK